MKSSLTLLALFALLSSAPVCAKEPKGAVSLTGGGGISYTTILNDRVDDGVSHHGLSLQGSLKLSITDILFPGGLRVEFGLRDILLPGTANVAGAELLFAYEGRFLLAGRTFTYGAGLGFSYNHAPTKDAASTWPGFALKVDLSTPVAGLVWGVYAKYEQLIMGGVADPLFVTMGLEVQIPLWGKAPEVPKRSEPKEVNTKLPPVTPTLDPTDNDGDKVPNTKDLCPSTKKGRKVESNGCRAIFDGMVFDDLTFPEGRATLSANARKELLRLAELLRANKGIVLVVAVIAKSAPLAQKRADLIEKELQLLKIEKERIKTAPQVGPAPQVSFNFRLGI